MNWTIAPSDPLIGGPRRQPPDFPRGALTAECVRRGFRVQVGNLVALPGCVAWEPVEADLQVNLGRLRAKLAAPPRAGFYRHCGAVVGADWYGVTAA